MIDSKTQVKLKRLEKLESQGKALQERLDEVQKKWESLNSDLKGEDYLQWAEYCDEKQYCIHYQFHDVLC